MTKIFDTKGLTSSEANHITNITKELVKDLNVTGMALTTSSVVRDGETLPLDENKKNPSWVQDIQKVGKLYSLSAWLKSAIKLKEAMLRDVDYRQFKTTVPDPELEELKVIPDTSFEKYLASLTIKERNEYLTAEAVATHVGKFVHNFDEVRSKVEDFTPTSFQRVGNETLTVKSERLYTKDELFKGFFELQKEHREAEQKVNLYKSRHKSWAKEIEDEVAAENSAIQDRNHLKKKEKFIEVTKERTQFEAQNREDKQTISTFKIVIPHDLQPVLDEVLEYAKK